MRKKAIIIGGIILCILIFILIIPSFIKPKLPPIHEYPFFENERLILYPNSKEIIIKEPNLNGFGFGISNQLNETNENQIFNYKVSLNEIKDCNHSRQEIENLIVGGEELDNINIPKRERATYKVILDIPESFGECTFNYKVEVYNNDKSYAVDYMNVTIK